MSLEAGARLGPYEILAPIGAGGMGEVYRASDTRLDRIVALKVLGERVAGRAGSRERFEREARAIAALSHPHICTLHDVGEQRGVDYLVMEYLEGETLARRLGRGPLPLPEAVLRATEIADALAAAHRHGVVHRDLKPGNIMLTRSGAKLLDFGLATLRQADPLVPASERKTLTAENVLVGTLPYMAPEQLEGRPADARTDLFAFGAVLYEMVTGTRAFAGESQASLIAAIVGGTVPPLASREPLAPASLDRLVAQCLHKDAEERWQSAHDVTLRLREIGDADPASAERQGAPSRRWWAWAGAALVLALLAGVAAGRSWSRVRGSPACGPVIRSQVDLAEGMAEGLLWRTEVAVSPEGQVLVWAADFGGGALPRGGRLYRRRLDEAAATPIPGTEGGSQPFFSPDGRWVVFCELETGTLRRVPLEGGLAVDLLDRGGPCPMGATSAPDGRILLGHVDGGIEWIPAEGGAPQSLTTVDPAREAGHRLPRLLPGGKALLFTAMPHAWGVGSRVEAVELATGNRTVLVEDAADGRYLPSGHLVFVRQGVLMAAPFDPDRLELRAPPVPVLEDVDQALNLGLDSANSGAGQFAVSDSGLLVYARGGIHEDPPAELVLVDRAGRVEPLPGFEKPLATSQARYSPDGRQIVFIEKARSGLLWLFDTERRTHRPLSRQGIAGFPVWSPDGRRVVVAWSAAGPLSLWSVPVGDVGEWESLPGSQGAFASSWSPDGRWLAFVADAEGLQNDVFLYDFERRQVSPFLSTPAKERYPEFSPDGLWMAYVSDESGRYEVYVTSFPEGEHTSPVSSEGATAPAWSRDGRTLFYVTLERALKEVSFSGQSGPVLGPPVTVLTIPPGLEYEYWPLRGYDLHPDGERFLMERTKAGAEWPAPITRLHLVQNWFAELERLSPTR